MNAPCRIYADNAEVYTRAGTFPIPADPRAKKPAVRGWQDATEARIRRWMDNPRLGAAPGVGILMGRKSGITEVDVDTTCPSFLALANDRYGPTPIRIRTASGKVKLWYRHNGEGRHIRPVPDEPIDILGDGFTLAPPSWREDLSTGYTFETGGIEDIAILPTMQGGDFATERSSAAVLPGKRNNTLWRWCMAQARFCDDVDALLDAAATWADDMPDKLSSREIEAVVKSAWGYEASGRNYLGMMKPTVTAEDVVMDGLLDCPEAFTLLAMFKRWHGNREAFAIAPRAMANAGSPPWPRRRIEDARDVLVKRGHLEVVVPPSRGKRQAGRYRLASIMPKSGHNHNTPAPPVPGVLTERGLR